MESGYTPPSPRPSLQQLMTKLNAFAEDYTLTMEDLSVSIDLLRLNAYQDPPVLNASPAN